MSESLLTVLVSGACTLIGTLGGILAASRLTNYRIERLEKAVEKHNKVVERTFRLEGRMDEAEHDIASLRDYHRPGSN